MLHYFPLATQNGYTQLQTNIETLSLKVNGIYKMKTLPWQNRAPKIQNKENDDSSDNGLFSADEEARNEYAEIDEQKTAQDQSKENNEEVYFIENKKFNKNRRDKLDNEAFEIVERDCGPEVASLFHAHVLHILQDKFLSFGHDLPDHPNKRENHHNHEQERHWESLVNLHRGRCRECLKNELCDNQLLNFAWRTETLKDGF